MLHNERCAAWKEKVRSVENVTSRKWISVGGGGGGGLFFGGGGGIDSNEYYTFFPVFSFLGFRSECRKKEGKNEEVINC